MIALSVAKLKMFSPETEISLWIKPKKKKKNFCGKFGSMPTFRSTRKGKKCFLWWAYVRLTTRCYTASHPHQVFFDFAGIFSLFSLVFCTSKFSSLRNLIKQLCHSHTLDMRLVIANSALRASLAIYISYPTRTHGIIVNYPPKRQVAQQKIVRLDDDASCATYRNYRHHLQN